MLFDVQIDDIITSFQEIQDSFTTNKLSEVQKKKESKKKEIQDKIRDFGSKKKFPYLVFLNVEQTKVTQYSLCQILKTSPFNMNFRMESLFQQYAESKYCILDDHVVYQLSLSQYLQNFKVLNLENVECTSASLNKIFRSKRSVNLRAIYLNTKNISEDAFITLSNSKFLPKLNEIKIQEDDKILCKSYHYFLRSQYLSMNLKIDDLMKKAEVVDTSQFIQAIINSFYMNNISSIEIHNCSLFMNQIKSLFKLSMFTGNIMKVTLEDVKDTEENKDVWITISQSKSFPKLQFLSIKSLEIREHLIILLKQKYKPLFDIESLLKNNKKLIDDQIIVEISELPHLLNSKDIDFSDLSKIRPKAWEAFANSKYVGNLKAINFSDCTLMSSKVETDQQAIQYYRQHVDSFYSEKTKCQSIFQKNNFFNLDKIYISNNKGLHTSEIEFILQSIKKRHVSVRFNFEDIFIQLIEQIKPFLVEYASQKKVKEDDEEIEMDEEERQLLAQFGLEQEKHSSVYKQELILYLWESYIPELHNLFEKFFLKTREWYNIRHTTLDLTYYQFLIRFNNFQNVFRQIQDLSCIQNLKFYNFGFDSVFSSPQMKFLNLKTVKVIDVFNEKGLNCDKNGSQLKKILGQQYIKPYYFQVNQFMENYKINNNIQRLFLNSTYMQIQDEFKVYLKYIEKEQIAEIFKKTHFAAKQIILKDSYKGDKDIDKVSIEEKQEYFLTQLASSKCFSSIKKLEITGQISLPCLKLLIQSKVFHSTYDIQKLVGLTEVDQEYFDLLGSSRYFSNINTLLIPKFQEVVAASKPQEAAKLGGKTAQSAQKQPAETFQKEMKYKFSFDKFNINKISKLTHIKIIENIEDPEFLKELFNFDNVRFNSSFACVDKFDMKRLKLIQFQKLLLEPKFGYDWTVVFQLLEKNLLTQESNIYEAILRNQSACFFLNELEFSETTTKEIATDIMQTIIKTMSSIKEFMGKLQLNKLIIKSFPEKEIQTVLEFFKLIQNLKEVQIKSDIVFDLDEAKELILHTKNTNLAETVLNWIIPKLNKQDLLKLKDSLKDDKETPMNVSYLDFTGNQYFLSKNALEQKIIDLRISKKGVIKDEDEEEAEQDLAQEKQQNVEEEENDKENKNENEVKKEGEEENDNAGGGEEEDAEEDGENKGDDKENENDEKSQLDNKQMVARIQDLQKNSITEDDLFDFLSLFKGVREISFQKTQADIYHLVKVKRLDQAQYLSFINFQDCSEFKNCVSFAILLEGDLKPWFQLSKYLDHLPLNKGKNQMKFMKAFFHLDFFKKNFKYINLDFILKIYQGSNMNLLATFEKIIIKRMNNLDITAFLQNLPHYMKQAVNDYHIEKLCKDYGCIHYLQPEKYPNVQYGFNHILQQKNIPTSIRLMYLLNEAFQKKISAASLSLIYQLALESDQLKQRNIVKESDEQLFKILLTMLNKTKKKKINIEKKKRSAEKDMQKMNDRKYLKVLNAVGKKKVEKKKTVQDQSGINKFAPQKISAFKPNNEEVNTPALAPEENQNDDVFGDDDGQENKNDNAFNFNEKDLQDQDNREQQIDLYDDNNKEGDEDLEKLDKDGDEEGGGEDEGEGEEGEGEEGEGEGEGLEGEQNEGEGYEEVVDEQQEGDEQNINGENGEINVQDQVQENFESRQDGFDNDDENQSFKNKARLNSNGLLNGNGMYTDNADYDSKRDNSGIDKRRQSISKVKTIARMSTIQKNKKPKIKTIKHQFEGIEFTQPKLKGNVNRVYNNPVALRLHKELVNLHVMSQSLKNTDKRVNYFKHIINELDNQIDFIQFEIQLLEINKRDNNYEIANLFSFIEILNLGENNHLNIYGLNFYISQHIQPWIKLNQNIGELKDGKKRVEKIQNNFEQKDEDDDISGIINPDHVLDDKMFEHLSFLIEEKLRQLREINLKGLNVSDDFAEKFSLILGDDSKLKHLNLLDLTYNRRLSPFGLKFLFSSIVNRIPEGFKIVLSATNNDADHLRQQIELIEKSIMKEAVWIVKKQKQEIAKYIKKNKRKLNKPMDTKVAPFEKSASLDDLDSAEQHQSNMKKLNLQLFDPHMPKLSEDEIEEDFGNSPDHLNDANKDMIDEGKLELQKLDYQSNASEDEKELKFQKGELTFMFINDQTLDKKIIKKLEKDKSFKDKISRLRILQIAYKKAIAESGTNNLATQLDARMIIQNVVNLGLYDAINIVIRDTWKRNKFTIILISIIFLPLTIFHLLMLSTYRLTFFLKKNSITIRCGFGKSKENKIFVELDKLIPDNIESTDFYFDEDVSQIDILLSRNQTKKVSTEIQRRNGRLVSQYINNPLKMDFNLIYKEINSSKSKESHILKYVDVILWFYIIIFLLVICVAYPYYLIHQYLPTYQPSLGCGTYPLVYDTPFFVIVVILLGLETAVLQNIEAIIVSKKIFNLRSLSVIIQLYSSFMLRYNIYSNVVFAHIIMVCESKNAEDLGLISIIFLNVYIAWTVIPAILNMIKLILMRRRSLAKPIHNTAFINQFTQLTQMLDFIGLSFVLDRFSTSSTITLSGFFIPNFLKNVKIPQILLSKFQKLFYLDFPQISILLIYNLRKSSVGNLLSFENIRVVLTTLLSIYSSLSQAWQAHPSVFRTYQMQDYLKFRQDTPHIYKIKIGTKEDFQHFKIQDVISKVFTFNQRFTLKIETPEEKRAKRQREKERQQKQKKREKDRDASSKVASSVAGSVVSDNKSQAQSQRSIGSQASIQSNKSASNGQGGTTSSGGGSSSDNRKIILPENFQPQLIEFIKKNDKLKLDQEEKQE